MTREINMTPTDYAALEDARQHTIRALSAARATCPHDAIALATLCTVRDQLAALVRLLDALKQRARVPHEGWGIGSFP